MTGLGVALVGAGVIGLWGMNQRLSDITARFESWQRISEQRDVQHTDSINGLAKRIGEDEIHIFHNDARIDELQRQFNGGAK